MVLNDAAVGCRFGRLCRCGGGGGSDGMSLSRLTRCNSGSLVLVVEVVLLIM